MHTLYCHIVLHVFSMLYCICALYDIMLYCIISYDMLYINCWPYWLEPYWTRPKIVAMRPPPFEESDGHRATSY